MTDRNQLRHPLRVKRILLPISLCVMFVSTGCDSDKPAADKKAEAKKTDDKAVPATTDKAPAATGAPDGAEPAVEAAADGLDPSLDNSKLDETGKAIAALFDGAKTCAYDMNSQIAGCKQVDEFRAMQKKVSPMTAEFAAQRDLVAVTRLASKEPTVRAWAYSLCGPMYGKQEDVRPAVEAAISAETDTVALLVGLRKLRNHLGSNPSLKPIFEKHAASEVKEVAETAQAALDKAAG